MRRSVTGPFLLIAVGLFFLLRNLRPDLPMLSTLANYWPFLLIGLGVVGLVEVLVHAGRGATGAPVRPIGAGAIFWIVVLCIFFSVASRHNSVVNLGDLDTGRITILGSDYDYDTSVTAAEDGATKLVVDNIRGSLTLRGDASASGVKVTGRKIVRAFSRDDAEKANRNAPIRIDREGDQLVIRARDGSGSQTRVSADLEIAVPRNMSVEVRGRTSDVAVNDIDGSVSVSGGRGDVVLQSIGGGVRVDSSRGGSIRVSNLRSDFDLSGRGSDVRVDKVSGLVTVSGEYSGTLQFSAIAKPFHFESSRTDFSAEAIPGVITLDLSDLHLENVTGPVRFHTSSRDVDARQISGSLDLAVDHGDIKIDATNGPLPKMDVHSHNGDISLILPAKSPFQLDGSTTQGEVQNSYGSPLDVTTSGRSSTIRGRTGNGPQISATTDRGELSVRKG